MTPASTSPASPPVAATAMGPFDTLMQVDITHLYFAAGICRGLSLQPTATTAALLQRAGALWRSGETGLVIYHDRGRRAALRRLVGDGAAPFVLVFVARSSDPWLSAYTAGLQRDPTTLMCLDSRCAMAPDADGRRRLHRDAFAGTSQRARIDGPFLSRQLGRVDRLMPPAFVLRLALRRGSVDGLADDAPATPTLHYLLRLQSTHTRWKYYLPGEWVAQQPRVVDLAGQTAFEPAATEQLADGRKVLTIRSQGTLPLQQLPSQRFQLRTQGPQAERVLIKRLPVASAGQISAETIDGVRSMVSEIYVNR